MLFIILSNIRVKMILDSKLINHIIDDKGHITFIKNVPAKVINVEKAF